MPRTYYFKTVFWGLLLRLLAVPITTCDGGAGNVLITPDPADGAISHGFKNLKASSAGSERLCFTFGNRSVDITAPACNSGGSTCTIGAPVFDGSILPVTISLNAKALKIQGCSFDGAHSAVRTIEYTTIRPAMVRYRPPAVSVSSGPAHTLHVALSHRVELESVSAGIICYTLDGTLPGCSASSLRCQETCHSCVAVNGSRGNTTPVTHTSDLRALGCSSRNNAFLSGEASAVQLTIVVGGVSFTPPPNSPITHGGRGQVFLKSAGADFFCYRVLGDGHERPKCSQQSRTCAHGEELNMTHNMTVAWPIGWAPGYQVVEAVGCNLSLPTATSASSATFPHVYMNYLNSLDTEVCEAQPQLPQCNTCDGKLEKLSINFIQSQTCAVPVPNTIDDAIQRGASNETCVDLQWSSISDWDNPAPYDNVHVCGSGGGCSNSARKNYEKVNICKTDDNDCFKSQLSGKGFTFAESERICDTVGARMCTLPELMRGEAYDSKCYDNAYVWSHTRCKYACTWDGTQWVHNDTSSTGYYKVWGGGVTAVSTN